MQIGTELTPLCHSCSQKNTSYEEMTLKEAKRKLQERIGYKLENRSELRMICRERGISVCSYKKCKLGIPCTYLQDANRIIKMLGEDVCMLLVAFIRTKPSTGEFYQMLSWTRGSYPNVYSAAERYYYETINNND